jgi:hypothetical protein
MADKDDELEPEFEALLEYLRGNRGFDFTGYRRAGLTRPSSTSCSTPS